MEVGNLTLTPQILQNKLLKREQGLWVQSVQYSQVTFQCFSLKTGRTTSFTLSEKELHFHVIFSKSRLVKNNPHVIRKFPKRAGDGQGAEDKPKATSQDAGAHPLPSTQLLMHLCHPSRRVTPGEMDWSQALKGQAVSQCHQLPSPTWLRYHHEHHFPLTSPGTGQIRPSFKICTVCKSKRHIYKQKSQDC